MDYLNFLNEILETSSSDSDDDGELYLMYLRKRKGPNTPKIRNYIDIVHTFSEHKFKRHFRMSRTTVQSIQERFENSDEYKNYSSRDHGGSERISAECHILAFIWFAANKAVLRDVSERFGVGETTLFRMMNRVMTFLVAVSKEYIAFPTTEAEKVNAASNFFAVSGFPNVIGCIDGTSIAIRTPAHKIKSTYVNRHDIPSITLQAICNSQKQFIDVFTGPPGKIHDSRVFKLSFISKNIEEICHGKFHLLGDSAYSISEYLLTPYRDYGSLNEAEKLYNKNFSRTRVLIENSFGLLKSRFRQLLKLEFHEVDKMTKFLISCCVLHNICIEYKDFVEIEEEYEDDDFNVQHEDASGESKRKGENKRETIKEFFQERNH